MTKFDKREFDRAFWDACAGDEVMSVIRNGLRSDVWKSGLMEAHLHLVYHYAHLQNERVDFEIRNAGWLKKSPACRAHGIGAPPTPRALP